MELAGKLREWRARAGLSQAKAAAALEMSKKTYEGIEQGRPFTYAGLMLLAIEALEGRNAAQE